MAIVTTGTISNLQNAPVPVQQYFYIEGDQDSGDPLVFPGSTATVPYWAQDEFSFDIEFSVIEEPDTEGANTEIWVVTNVTYDGMRYGTGDGATTPGDFFSGTTFSSIGDPNQIDSVTVEAIENPFDEYYHIEQTYNAGSSGKIDTRFNEQALEHEAETNLDEGYLNVDTFAYIPPDDETFKTTTNRYELQQLSDILDEGGEQSEFLGVSRWELPSDRFLEIVHDFTVFATGQTSGNEIEVSYSVYHESHWNFDKARVFAERLQNEEAILNANDTDQSFEDAQSVEPDNPQYELDPDIVSEFPDVETPGPDANTAPIDPTGDDYDPNNIEFPTGVPDIEDGSDPERFNP